jgi:hypothetical protein
MLPSEPPRGPILAVGVADLHEEEALLAAHPLALLSIPHFDKALPAADLGLVARECVAPASSVVRRWCTPYALTAWRAKSQRGTQ